MESTSPTIGPMGRITVVDDPDDFQDVFGGPPRTVLLRKFNFYREIFPPPPDLRPPEDGGRILPAFRIPSRNGEGIRDRSQLSKSKSTSSWVMSSEETMSPLQRLSGDDVGLSSFASKLRPLNIPLRWMMSDKQARKQATQMPSLHSPSPPSLTENQFEESDFVNNFNTTPYNSFTRHSSPETITLEPNSYRADELEEFNSTWPLLYKGFETEYADDEVMSSYVIETTSDYRDEVSIDEAIAFAKGKYKTSLSTEPEKDHLDEWEKRSHEIFDQQSDTLDRLWVAGKENDIRLLLSTLDHVLWPSSGWYPIPLTSLTDSTQVKNAYQKARLCLHPEKLQEKGATLPQKYLAEKVFSILEDAWTQFVNQDVF